MMGVMGGRMGRCGVGVGVALYRSEKGGRREECEDDGSVLTAEEWAGEDRGRMAEWWDGIVDGR